jgi:hypothetical protein
LSNSENINIGDSVACPVIGNAGLITCHFEIVEVLSNGCCKAKCISCAQITVEPSMGDMNMSELSAMEFTGFRNRIALLAMSRTGEATFIEFIEDNNVQH